MKHDYNKNVDVIEAEFVSENIVNNEIDKNKESNESKIISFTEYNYEKKYSNKDNYFSYKIINNSNLKKISFFKLILLTPFLLLFFSLIILFVFVIIVIFLPKIFKIIRKKGISGLKMDYNFLKRFLSHFKIK